MSLSALSARAEISDKSLVRSFSYINGKWCASSNGEVVAVHDPATGDFIGDVTAMTAEDSSAAVDAAAGPLRHPASLV